MLATCIWFPFPDRRLIRSQRILNSLLKASLAQPEGPFGTCMFPSQKMWKAAAYVALRMAEKQRKLPDRLMGFTVAQFNQVSMGHLHAR